MDAVDRCVAGVVAHLECFRRGGFHRGLETVEVEPTFRVVTVPHPGDAVVADEHDGVTARAVPGRTVDHVETERFEQLAGRKQEGELLDAAQQLLRVVVVAIERSAAQRLTDASEEEHRNVPGDVLKPIADAARVASLAILVVEQVAHKHEDGRAITSVLFDEVCEDEASVGPFLRVDGRGGRRREEFE